MLATHFQPLLWLCINRIISSPHLSPYHPAPEELYLYVATSNVFRNCKDYTVSNTFIVQLMHTTLKNVELLNHFKIKEAAETCFGLNMKPSSGSHSQYLAKITHSVQCEYMEVVQTLSVLWLYSMTCIRSHSAQHTRLTLHTPPP
jgi:hypothetical protein